MYHTKGAWASQSVRTTASVVDDELRRYSSMPYARKPVKEVGVFGRRQVLAIAVHLFEHIPAHDLEFPLRGTSIESVIEDSERDIHGAEYGFIHEVGHMRKDFDRNGQCDELWIFRELIERLLHEFFRLMEERSAVAEYEDFPLRRHRAVIAIACDGLLPILGKDDKLVNTRFLHDLDRRISTATIGDDELVATWHPLFELEDSFFDSLLLVQSRNNYGDPGHVIKTQF